MESGTELLPKVADLLRDQVQGEGENVEGKDCWMGDREGASECD